MILIEEDNPQVRIRGGNSKSFRKGYFSTFILVLLFFFKWDFQGWKHVTKPIRKAVDKVTEAEEITETDNEAEKYSFISMLPNQKHREVNSFKFTWFALQCYNLSLWVVESSITPNSKVIPIPVIPEKALRIRDEDSQFVFLSE